MNIKPLLTVHSLDYSKTVKSSPFFYLVLVKVTRKNCGQ